MTIADFGLPIADSIVKLTPVFKVRRGSGVDGSMRNKIPNIGAGHKSAIRPEGTALSGRNPKSEIQVVNRQRGYRLNRRRLAAVARHVLKAEGVASAQVEIAVVGDPEIARLNRRYLKHRGPTDVLSFDLTDEPRTAARPGAAATTSTTFDARSPMPKAHCPMPIRRLTHDTANSLRRGERAGDLMFQIVVSADSARRQARRLGVPVFNELALYVTHGLLHLLGYDDRSAAARKRMWARQAELCSRMGLALKD